MLKAIDLFTQNSIMIKVNEKTIYFDPYDFEPDFEPHDADIIFITHPHYDHYSPDDIRKIMNDNILCGFSSLKKKNNIKKGIDKKIFL